MRSKGFTAIEVLVSLGIFAVLLTTVMNAFVRGFASQKRIIELHSVQRDSVYLMEILSREIRMASDTPQAPSGNNSTGYRFVFKDRNDRTVTYCRAIQNGSGYECNAGGDYFVYDDGTGGGYKLMNSSDVKVTALAFDVSQASFVTSEPMVTISMTLQSRLDEGAKMTVQTSVAMRLYYKHST